jgi:hypothetical protein
LQFPGRFVGCVKVTGRNYADTMRSVEDLLDRFHVEHELSGKAQAAEYPVPYLDSTSWQGGESISM